MMSDELTSTQCRSPYKFEICKGFVFLDVRPINSKYLKISH